MSDLMERAEYFKDLLEGMGQDTVRCPCCGNTFPLDDDYLVCNPALERYLKDSLEVVYSIKSNGEYVSSRITLEYGGPNTFIDTATGMIEVHWGGKEGTARLNDRIVEMIDLIMEREQKYAVIEGGSI